jgi:hypothetical protein
MDRKKELKMQFKQMKPEMGIMIVRAKSGNKYFLQGTQNLKGFINRTKFQLDSGGHPNRELQKCWQELGEKNFTIEVLEELEYEKDESKTDYSEDLALLEMVWQEKLAEQGLEPYKK